MNTYSSGQLNLVLVHLIMLEHAQSWDSHAKWEIVDQAFNKPSFMSGNNANAAVAVRYPLDAHFKHGCAHSAKVVHPRWRVTIGNRSAGSQRIRYVLIGFKPAKGESLENFTVSVIKKGDPRSPFECYHFHGAFPVGVRLLRCNTSLRGHEVEIKIVKNTPRILTLCKVSVFRGWPECFRLGDEDFEAKKVFVDYRGRACKKSCNRKGVREMASPPTCTLNGTNIRSPCTIPPCFRDFEATYTWTTWTACSATCGPNSTRARYKICHEPKYKGKPCPMPRKQKIVQHCKVKQLCKEAVVLYYHNSSMAIGGRHANIVCALNYTPHYDVFLNVTWFSKTDGSRSERPLSRGSKYEMFINDEKPTFKAFVLKIKTVPNGVEELVHMCKVCWRTILVSKTKCDEKTTTTQVYSFNQTNHQWINTRVVFHPQPVRVGGNMSITSTFWPEDNIKSVTWSHPEERDIASWHYYPQESYFYDKNYRGYAYSDNGVGVWIITLKRTVLESDVKDYWLTVRSWNTRQRDRRLLVEAWRVFPTWSKWSKYSSCNCDTHNKTRQRQRFDHGVLVTKAQNKTCSCSEAVVLYRHNSSMAIGGRHANILCALNYTPHYDVFLNVTWFSKTDGSRSERPLSRGSKYEMFINDQKPTFKVFVLKIKTVPNGVEELVHMCKVCWRTILVSKTKCDEKTTTTQVYSFNQTNHQWINTRVVFHPQPVRVGGNMSITSTFWPEDNIKSVTWSNPEERDIASWHYYPQESYFYDKNYRGYAYSDNGVGVWIITLKRTVLESDVKDYWLTVRSWNTRQRDRRLLVEAWRVFPTWSKWSKYSSCNCDTHNKTRQRQRFDHGLLVTKAQNKTCSCSEAVVLYHHNSSMAIGGRHANILCALNYTPHYEVFVNVTWFSKTDGSRSERPLSRGSKYEMFINDEKPTFKVFVLKIKTVPNGVEELVHMCKVCWRTILVSKTKCDEKTTTTQVYSFNQTNHQWINTRVVFHPQPVRVGGNISITSTFWPEDNIKSVTLSHPGERDIASWHYYPQERYFYDKNYRGYAYSDNGVGVWIVTLKRTVLESDFKDYLLTVRSWNTRQRDRRLLAEAWRVFPTWSKWSKYSSCNCDTHNKTRQRQRFDHGVLVTKAQNKTCTCPGVKRVHVLPKIQTSKGENAKLECRYEMEEGAQFKRFNWSRFPIATNRTEPIFEAIFLNGLEDFIDGRFEGQFRNRATTEYRHNDTDLSFELIGVTAGDAGNYTCSVTTQTDLTKSNTTQLTVIVNGNWGQWSPWSLCSVTCGEGEHIRRRTCNNPVPSSGGAPCHGVSEEAGNCFKYNCSPVDGGWSRWTAWTWCDVTCGGGTRSRARSCDNPVVQFGGKDCRGKSSQVKSCNTARCPGVDEVIAPHNITAYEGSSVNLSCKYTLQPGGRVRKVTWSHNQTNGVFAQKMCNKTWDYLFQQSENLYKKASALQTQDDNDVSMVITDVEMLHRGNYYCSVLGTNGYTKQAMIYLNVIKNITTTITTSTTTTSTTTTTTSTSARLTGTRVNPETKSAAKLATTVSRDSLLVKHLSSPTRHPVNVRATTEETFTGRALRLQQVGHTTKALWKSSHSITSTRSSLFSSKLTVGKQPTSSTQTVVSTTPISVLKSDATKATTTKATKLKDGEATLKSGGSDTHTSQTDKDVSVTQRGTSTISTTTKDYWYGDDDDDDEEEEEILKVVREGANVTITCHYDLMVGEDTKEVIWEFDGDPLIKHEAGKNKVQFHSGLDGRVIYKPGTGNLTQLTLLNLSKNENGSDVKCFVHTTWGQAEKCFVHVIVLENQTVTAKPLVMTTSKPGNWNVARADTGSEPESFSTDLDRCKRSVCMNNGVCVHNRDHSLYMCMCKRGFSGQHCEVNGMLPCHPNPCVNNGKCVSSPSQTAYRCQCSPGFAGRRCEDKRGETSSDMTGSNLDELQSLDEEDTKEGYISGANLPLKKNVTGMGIKFYMNGSLESCRPNPCKNGAQCVVTFTAQRCICEEGFTGRFCEIQAKSIRFRNGKNGSFVLDTEDRGDENMDEDEDEYEEGNVNYRHVLIACGTLLLFELVLGMCCCIIIKQNRDSREDLSNKQKPRRRLTKTKQQYSPVATDEVSPTSTNIDKCYMANIAAGKQQSSTRPFQPRSPGPPKLPPDPSLPGKPIRESSTSNAPPTTTAETSAKTSGEPGDKTGGRVPAAPPPPPLPPPPDSAKHTRSYSIAGHSYVEPYEPPDTNLEDTRREPEFTYDYARPNTAGFVIAGPLHPVSDGTYENNASKESQLSL